MNVSRIDKNYQGKTCREDVATSGFWLAKLKS